MSYGGITSLSVKVFGITPDDGGAPEYMHRVEVKYDGDKINMVRVLRSKDFGRQWDDVAAMFDDAGEYVVRMFQVVLTGTTAGLVEFTKRCRGAAFENSLLYCILREVNTSAGREWFLPARDMKVGDGLNLGFETTIAYVTFEAAGP